jgi:hypothetical protein
MGGTISGVSSFFLLAYIKRAKKISPVITTGYTMKGSQMATLNVRYAASVILDRGRIWAAINVTGGSESDHRAVWELLEEELLSPSLTSAHLLALGGGFPSVSQYSISFDACHENKVICMVDDLN